MHKLVQQPRQRAAARQQFNRDALAAWAEYQATGLHVTAAEAEAWLLRLEAGEDGDVQLVEVGCPHPSRLTGTPDNMPGFTPP